MPPGLGWRGNTWMTMGKRGRHVEMSLLDERGGKYYI